MEVALLVRATGLTKRFGPVTALDGLTVDIPPGRTGLVGANGAGKTTFFRLLLGLGLPTSGDLAVGGRAVRSDPVGVRAEIGYMPEHDCLPLDQTAADVVATFGELTGLPARAARQRASDVLDLVGLGDERFRPVAGFSTGMRQRTKLAQALVADPRLLLLDEPTAGLDPSGREEMLALVARIGTFGISVLLATHLLDDVQQMCDTVVMLDGGRLVVAGATDRLVERTGTLIVDVGERGADLVAALVGIGIHAVQVDGAVEVRVGGEGDVDAARDAIAGLTSTEVPDDLVRDGLPDGWAANVALVLITAACVELSTWRLAHVRPSGRPTDGDVGGAPTLRARLTGADRGEAQMTVRIRSVVLVLGGLVVLGGTFVLGPFASGSAGPRPTATSGAAATSGARIQVVVDSAGNTRRERGVASVTNEGEGIWCVTLVEPYKARRLVPAVTPEYDGSPDVAITAEWNKNALGCPTRSFEVRTYRDDGVNHVSADEGFALVVP